MKKIFRRVLLLVLLFTFIFSAVGCNNGGVEIDSTRTQLRIYAYNGGYGLEWLNDAIKNFEEKYATTSFEEGKIGVQCHLEPGSTGGGTLIGTGRYDVFFTEGSSTISDNISSGEIAPITDIVTEKLTEFGETRSIEDKFLSENQKSYFNVDYQGTGSGQYYTLPLYAAVFGIIYDVDLFDDYGFYFKEGGGFVTSKTDVKATGPDGVSRTSDDGLPATYDDFFALCDYMRDSGVQPFTLNGAYRDWYMERIMSNMHADNEGYDQIILNYSFKGMAKTLISVDESGIVSKIPETEINNRNGALVYKQAGRYYATDFLSRLINGEGYFDQDKTYSQSYSHTEAQSDFLYSNVVSTETPIGMLLEGNYWEEEAEKMGIYKQMSSRYSDVDRNDRRFGFMPFPKATAEQVYEGNRLTLQDSLFAQAFIPSTIKKEILPAAKKFLQFFYSDANLVNFTRLTGTMISMDYNISDEVRRDLSYYTNTIIDAFKSERTDYVYPSANNIMYLDNVGRFYENAWTSTIANTDKLHPISMLREGQSVKSIFDGYYLFREAQWEGFSQYF